MGYFDEVWNVQESRKKSHFLVNLYDSNLWGSPQPTQQTGDIEQQLRGQKYPQYTKVRWGRPQVFQKCHQEEKVLPLTEVIAAANGVSIHQRPPCTDWITISPNTCQNIWEKGNKNVEGRPCQDMGWGPQVVIRVRAA